MLPEEQTSCLLPTLPDFCTYEGQQCYHEAGGPRWASLWRPNWQLRHFDGRAGTSWCTRTKPNASPEHLVPAHTNTPHLLGWPRAGPWTSVMSGDNSFPLKSPQASPEMMSMPDFFSLSWIIFKILSLMGLIFAARQSQDMADFCYMLTLCLRWMLK